MLYQLSYSRETSRFVPRSRARVKRSGGYSS